MKISFAGGVGLALKDVLGGIERQLYPTTVLLRSPQTGLLRSGVIINADPGLILTSGNSGEDLEVFNGALMYQVPWGSPNLPLRPSEAFRTEGGLLNVPQGLQSFIFNKDFGGNPIDWAKLERTIDFDKYQVAKFSSVSYPQQVLLLGFDNEGYPTFRYTSPRQKGFSNEGVLNLEVGGLPESMMGAGVFSVEDSGLLGIVTDVEPNKVVVKSVMDDIIVMAKSTFEAPARQRKLGHLEPR